MYSNPLGCRGWDSSFDWKDTVDTTEVWQVTAVVVLRMNLVSDVMRMLHRCFGILVVIV